MGLCHYIVISRPRTEINNQMNNYCWYELKNFPVNILKPEFPIKSLQESTARIALLNSDSFSDELLAWTKERQIILTMAMSFYRINNVHDSAIHVDIGNNGGLAFNIQVCGEGVMSFYKIRCGTMQPKIQHTMARTPYMTFGYDQVDKIDETVFGSRAQMVRTDVPHNVHLTVAPRHALSVRIHTITGIRPTWENVTEALADDLIPR
jgi:hypothetical protein